MNQLEINGAFLRSRQFAALRLEDQQQIVYGNLRFYERGERTQPDRLEWIRNLFTTIILRNNCGCQSQTFIDETTGEEVTIDAHSSMCHRIRLPITEDLADSTILRRSNKQVSLSDVLEEKMNAR